MNDVRPVVVTALEPGTAASVLPAELCDRLAGTVELRGPGEARQEDLARADVLVTGWGSPVLTRAFLDGAPRLRAVLHAAGSVKPLVTPAVWERGIVVSSAAEANAGPVADYAFALVVLAAKKALATAAAYAEGRGGGGRARWPAFGDRQGGDGLTVGVVGASRIGRKVISRLRVSEAGYRVLVHDPYAAESVDLETLCRNSRVITLHAPELPGTRHLLNAERLALIPDGGAVINTARGSLIDTDQLARECASGRLDAYLDVTEPEPLEAGHPLLGLRNVLVTPHIAGAQGSEVRRLGVWVVEEVERWVRGLPLVGRVEESELHRLA
ncbi:hydroxyacid dehydrogenase [Streptomyces cinnamoneus]|uniref:hydroxyacid dehydrogenase n=1 Tax=Streptomyces cinnamoneus TaxID=53446 RepID=UPI0033C6C841